MTDRGEKLAGMQAITEHVVPGRWEDARQPNDKEFRGTTVLRLPIVEASLKQRLGDPVDDEEDLDLDVWAGTVPTVTGFGDPAAAADLRPGIPVPDYLAKFWRK